MPCDIYTGALVSLKLRLLIEEIKLITVGKRDHTIYFNIMRMVFKELDNALLKLEE